MQASSIMYTKLQLVEAIDKLSILTDERSMRLINQLRQQRQGDLSELLAATGLRPRQLHKSLRVLKSVGLVELSPINQQYYFNHYRFLRLLCMVYQIIPRDLQIKLA